MLGALGTYVVLNPHLVPASWGWRLSFILGGLLGLLILMFRHWVPESPRWLKPWAKSCRHFVAQSPRFFTTRPSRIELVQGGLKEEPSPLT
jgi:MFS family permease